MHVCAGAWNLTLIPIETIARFHAEGDAIAPRGPIFSCVAEHERVLAGLAEA